MNEGITAPEGGDQNPDDTNVPAPDPQADLAAALADQSRINARLMSQLEAQQNRPEPKKELTAEQYSELMKTNPAAAIELAVDKKVQERLRPEINRLSSERKKESYDQRAWTDFPQLKTDPSFQKAVQAQIKEFVENGEFAPDSPTLVYRAAQTASLMYKAKPGSGKGPGGMSSEAPTPRERGGGSKAPAKPENFDLMSDTFGLSKESKERLLAKMASKGDSK